jgi:signal transduction histidine kinase
MSDAGSPGERMAQKKEGQSVFRPRARLLVLLGEQLITNEVIGVVELVKNAYDADASQVRVVLERVDDPELGQITIEDDGSGMDLDTLLNVWLEPATAFRKAQHDQGLRTPRFKRLTLGEKGVGRFAVHKLGRLVDLVTRAAETDDEVTLAIDWSQFEADRYLEEVAVTWRITRPSHFAGDKSHGTRITVSGLRKKWDAGMVRQLYVNLQGLNSPFQTIADFTVDLDAPDFEQVIRAVPSIRDAMGSAFYSLEGTVDDGGNLDYVYTFKNEGFAEYRRELKGEEDVKHKRDFPAGRTPTCGPFQVRFYVWDRDPWILRRSGIDIGDFRTTVDPHTGVRVYRDGFRVWPYGERGDDWLGLDLRRVQAPPQRLSRNQIIGLVEISSTTNPVLQDKTDREGLIENKAFQDFGALVLGCITVLEAERRRDKDKVDRFREREKPRDEVQHHIDDLRARMEKNRDLDAYRSSLRKIETAYRRRLREIMDPLLVAAGLGLTYMLPVHELERNVQDTEGLLKHAMAQVQEGGSDRAVLDSLNQAISFLHLTDQVIRGVGRLSRRGWTTVHLASPVRNAVEIMRIRLEKDDIRVRVDVDESLAVRGQTSMIVTAILNLLDNCTYWLLQRPSDRQVCISGTTLRSGGIQLVVSDNGPGIKDDPALLIEPFYSRKPDGSGLGLYIVDRIMKSHAGRLEFLKDGSRCEGLLQGANVALVFPAPGES